MITIDPIFKLELLRDYMEWRIDNHPINNGQFIYHFHVWVKSYKRKYFPNTPLFIREIATHCYYCGKPMGEVGRFTIDHFDPVSNSDRIDGKGRIRVICCKKCNGRKTNLHPADYMRRLDIAVMSGGTFKGNSKSETKRINSQVRKIMDDIINNRAKICYYIRDTKTPLPKPYIEV